MNRPDAFVSLTYDDALRCHHETVAPLLEACGLRATFYTPCTPAMLADSDAWRRVAAAGHELGNHTLFHPCRAARSWLHEAYDLAGYTARRWRDEIAIANAVLRLMDGRDDRSFGNTCHQNLVGPAADGATVEALAPEFLTAARGEHTGRKVDIAAPSWFNLGTLGVDGRAFAELLPALEDVAESGGWLILTLHGVGPRDHSLHMAEDEHARFIGWLAERRESVATAPVRDVAARPWPAVLRWRADCPGRARAGRRLRGAKFRTPAPPTVRLSGKPPGNMVWATGSVVSLTSRLRPRWVASRPARAIGKRSRCSKSGIGRKRGMA